MKAEKPTRWRPQVADGTVPAQVLGPYLEPWKLRVCSAVWVQRQEKAGAPALESQTVRENSLLLFVLSRPPTDGWGPPMMPRAICFTQYINSNVHLQPKHPHRHTRIAFGQISGHPMAQLTWPIKFTITDHHKSFKVTTGLFVREVLNHHYERKTKVTS